VQLLPNEGIVLFFADLLLAVRQSGIQLAVGTVTEPTVTDRLHTKYANHSFAEPEAGRKSRRDGNAQAEAACILVDFIGSSIQLFHRYSIGLKVLGQNYPHQLFHPPTTSRDYHQLHNAYSDLYL
jgi:hypothetical protein